MAAGVGAIGVACAVTVRGAAGRAAARDASGLVACGVEVSVFVASAARSLPVQLATTRPVMSAVAMTSAMAMAVTFQGFHVFICHLLFARNARVTSPLPRVTCACRPLLALGAGAVLVTWASNSARATFALPGDSRA